MASRTPIVGVPCDRRFIEQHAFHVAGEKYLLALRDGAQAMPLLIPVLEPALPVEPLLAACDGFLFTGAVSNVDPALYGGPRPREDNIADPDRDRTTLPLIRAALAAAKPCLFICRGHQELNVALGGTLFQHVREEPGRFDHTDDAIEGLEAKYAPVHEVTVEPGGLLARLIPQHRFRVNSLHAQAIDRLGPGLAVEATADDGTIEAVSVRDARAFALGLQWHPEWQWNNNLQSRALFAAFAAALRGETV